MRRWPSRVVFAGLAGLAVLMVALPPLERKLLEQPSCFAFLGTIPQRRPPARPDTPTDVFFRETRGYAMGQRGGEPKPPYIVVLREEEGTIANAFVATRTLRGWQVDELLLRRDQKRGETPFIALPPRRPPAATTERLDALMAKTCLFKEPASVRLFPRVWFGLEPRPVYFDGEIRTIEVNDGVRSHSVTQVSQAGITGALGALVVKDRQGLGD